MVTSTMELLLKKLRNSDVKALTFNNISFSTVWNIDSDAISKNAKDFLLQLMNCAKQNLPCWFCGTPLISGEEEWYDKFYVCPTCTWNCSENYWSDDTVEQEIALLRPFNLSSKNENLTAVAFALIQNWNRVHDLHYSTMERFVASVIKGLFDCEVKWVGKSGDGGIDLIALISDEPVVVQVKRRTKHNSVEGVQIVREFCGAMIEHGYEKGMIVTTADHFSVPASTSAKRIMKTATISKMELIDSKALCDLFGLIRTDYDKWKKAFLLEKVVRTKSHKPHSTNNK